MGKSAASRLGAVLLFGALAGFVGLGAGCGGSPSGPPSSTKAIKYQIVEQWSLPNGGFGRAIVVGSDRRTETGLVALARQLREETKLDRNAFIFIYDDARAAGMRKAALGEGLSTADLKYHDDHAIGSYFRNVNTGYHALMVTLGGAGEPTKEIPLR